MPKKAYEETPYDPFAAAQQLAEQPPPKAAPIKTEPPTRKAPRKPRGGGAKPKPQGVPTPATNIVDLPRPDASRSTLGAPSYSVTRRFRTTDEQDGTIEELVSRFRLTSATKVDFSVLTRVLWDVLEHAEAQIQDTLEKRELPPRPNKNQAQSMADYDAVWRQVLISALRKMPPAK